MSRPSASLIAFREFRTAVPSALSVSLADRDGICAYVEYLEHVADDALALLDQHISDEQRRELGLRIIDRLTAIGRLT